MAIEVIAVLPDGREIPSTLCLWQNKDTERMTGLLVADGDTESMAYAEELAKLGIMI